MLPSIVYQHMTSGLRSDHQQILLNTGVGFETAIRNTELVSTEKLEGGFTAVILDNLILLTV
jgi:hypothetical protein